MPSRSNLRLAPIDCEPDVRKVLNLLAERAHLASELPKLPNGLIAAEERGLAKAVCLERNTYPVVSVWRWSITPKGKRWLQATPEATSRTRGKQRARQLAARIGADAVTPKRRTVCNRPNWWQLTEVASG
jgi:hypothetical protein